MGPPCISNYPTRAAKTILNWPLHPYWRAFAEPAAPSARCVG